MMMLSNSLQSSKTTMVAYDIDSNQSMSTMMSRAVFTRTSVDKKLMMKLMMIIILSLTCMIQAETCSMNTRSAIQSAVNQANSRSSETATLITLCKDSINIDFPITLFNKYIKFNCIISGKPSAMCSLDVQGISQHFQIGDSRIIFEQINFINGKSRIGGSLLIMRFSDVNVLNCIFSNNKADFAFDVGIEVFSLGEGGAIYIKDSNLVMTNTLMTNNTAGHDGGAIFSYDSNLVLINNIFTGNTAPNGNDIITNGGTLVRSDMTSKPSSRPSSKPSRKPSSKPSNKPSSKPSNKPSSKPSRKPSSKPSRKPSSTPSHVPSMQLSAMPTNKPSIVSSSTPSQQTSIMPSANPSMKPSASPSSSPSSSPSASPSLRPSTVSSTFKWILYNAKSDANISVIAMDQIFSFTNTGTNLLSIRLEAPSNTRRVVFSWVENRRTVTSTENNHPYYMGQNRGSDAFHVGYLSTPGVKIVNVRVTDALGSVIGTSTMRFTLV